MRIVLATVGALAFAAPAAADLAKGVTAYRQGDYASAMQQVLPLAERDDAEAQYYAGAMYEAGLGVEQSYDKAVGWYRRAAEQGLVMAQYHLGVLFETGEGIGRDYERAIEWYLGAAVQGYGPAQSNLASLYMRGGWGLESNPLLAHVWYNLAEDQDFPGAKRKRMFAEQFLSSEQIPDAERLAQDHKRAMR